MERKRMTAAVVEARVAERGDLPQVVATLARAFFDDPINRWIVPDDAQRRQGAPAFWSTFTNACWAHGTVFTAGSESGAALWVPPGKPLVSDSEEEEFQRAVLESAGSAEAADRMADLMTMMAEHHPAEDHWYLPFIGVDPTAQGHGIGSALLRIVLAEADRDGIPAYLEASSPQNQRLYERHGFVSTRQLTVSDAPPIYAMWREPNSL